MKTGQAAERSACTKCAHFDACRGGCIAAKFFTGLVLDGPYPECVQGYGETAPAGKRTAPAPSRHHSRRTPTRNRPVLLQRSRRDELTLAPAGSPVSAGAEHPLAGYTSTA